MKFAQRVLRVAASSAGPALRTCGSSRSFRGPGGGPQRRQDKSGKAADHKAGLRYLLWSQAWKGWSEASMAGDAEPA